VLVQMPRPRRDGTQAASPNKRKLNDLFVKRLAPADSAYLVWDDYQRGLAVNVQPTGRKTFKCIYSQRAPSLRTVAAALADHGYVTPSGKHYSASAVASMLSS
jgi:hypothetical protein